MYTPGTPSVTLTSATMCDSQLSHHASKSVTHDLSNLHVCHRHAVGTLFVTSSMLRVRSPLARQCRQLVHRAQAMLSNYNVQHHKVTHAGE